MTLLTLLWTRGRIVTASSLGSKSHAFGVKIANHCQFHKAPFVGVSQGRQDPY